MPNKANLHERRSHRMALKGLSGGVICQAITESSQKKCFYMYNYNFYYAQEKYYKTYHEGALTKNNMGFYIIFRFTLHLLYI